MSTKITSRARRPKNAWFLFPSTVGDKFQIDIGYKSGTGKIGLYSASPQSATVKAPWGPPTKCEFIVRRTTESEVVREFKFSNGRNQTVAFDEIILNHVECGVNRFTRKLVSLCVKGHKKLLAKYVTLAQHAEGFIHHRDVEHDQLGLTLDGSGIGEAELEGLGGSLDEYKQFINLVKDNARDAIGKNCESVEEANEKGDGRKKRKSNNSGEQGLKKSKVNIVNDNEKKELEDMGGLEKQFKQCYIGYANIPLANLTVASELKEIVNMIRVYGIVSSIRSRYDPSQTVLVVCPEDDTAPPDLENLGEQKFMVVQKIHTFLAFEELSKKGEFRKLTGHESGTVLCYVLNTHSSALIRYGSIRGNEIASKYARRTYPQDLLHVFGILVKKESRVGALKVVDRMSRLSRVGPDESCSISKLCKWSEAGFSVLMEVISKFEDYETCDLRSASGNVGSIARCEKQKMTNAVFNKLAKCDEKHFVQESDKVMTGTISLRSVIEEYQTVVEIEKVFAVLSQLSGFVNKNEIMLQYPGKFENAILSKFIGAEIKDGKKNDQASLLSDYWEKSIKQTSDEYVDPVSFEEIDETKELVDKNYDFDSFDFVILNLKEAQSDLCMKVMKDVTKSPRVFVAAMMLFPSEKLQFENLSCLRSMCLGDMEKLKIVPIYFTNMKQKSDGKMCENMDFGILFGKFSVLLPPLKRAYSNLDNLNDIVKKICPPKSTVAMVTDQRLKVIKVHSSDLEQTVKYFGSPTDLSKFKDHLRKDKKVKSSQEVGNEERKRISDLGGSSSSSSELVVTTPKTKKSDDAVKDLRNVEYKQCHNNNKTGSSSQDIMTTPKTKNSSSQEISSDSCSSKSVSPKSDRSGFIMSSEDPRKEQERIEMLADLQSLKLSLEPSKLKEKEEKRATESEFVLSTPTPHSAKPITPHSAKPITITKPDGKYLAKPITKPDGKYLAPAKLSSTAVKDIQNGPLFAQSTPQAEPKHPKQTNLKNKFNFRNGRNQLMLEMARNKKPKEKEEKRSSIFEFNESSTSPFKSPSPRKPGQ